MVDRKKQNKSGTDNAVPKGYSWSTMVGVDSKGKKWSGEAAPYRGPTSANVTSRVRDSRVDNMVPPVARSTYDSRSTPVTMDRGGYPYAGFTPVTISDKARRGLNENLIGPAPTGTHDEQVRQAWDAAAAAGGIVPEIGTDRWNGMTLEEFLMWQQANNQNATTTSGGSGSRGSGSGVARNPDPLGWDAIARAQAYQNFYDQNIAAYQPAWDAATTGFTNRGNMLSDTSKTADAALQKTIQDLTARAATTRGDVAASYGGLDQKLADLAAQYSQSAKAQQNAAGQTVQAFGADPGAVNAQNPQLQSLLGALRAGSAASGQAQDVMYAGMPSTYAGLGADIQTSRANQLSALQNRLAQEQAASSGDIAAQRAKLALQLQQQLLDSQLAEQQRRAQYNGN